MPIVKILEDLDKSGETEHGQWQRGNKKSNQVSSEQVYFHVHFAADDLG